MARVCVVIPVFNRHVALQRALRSLINQTFEDWECVVVDDASPTSVAESVAHLSDPRISLMRRDHNGGPAAARRTAFSAVDAPFVLCLDSDWQLYPWALAQGLWHFGRHEQVAQVTGLCLRNEDSRLFVRAAGAPRTVTPEDFRTQEPHPDRVALVRRAVVEEWLTVPGRFFALESVLWTTTSLRHLTLDVDEPWVLYHTESEDRVTAAGPTTVGRSRAAHDAAEFIRTQEHLFNCGPCVTVDHLLSDALFTLVRARLPEARSAAHIVRRRGGRPIHELLRQLSARVRGRLRRRLPWYVEPTHWVGSGLSTSSP